MVEAGTSPFSSAHMQELVNMLSLCLADSKRLLELEAQINYSVQSRSTQNVFLMLATVLTDSSVPVATRHFAGVVLKNMLRNHLITLNSGTTQKEIAAVKQMLLQFLAT
jgi:hypothetical protein